MLITRMLIVASAAPRKVGASGRDTMHRRLEDLIDSGPDEARLLPDQSRFNFFVSKNKRDERSLAASVLVGGKTRKTVAAVDQLFDCEEQELILRHRKRGNRIVEVNC
jgi:hypothetical protein